jgi:putative hydrolases of HD superfamily
MSKKDAAEMHTIMGEVLDLYEGLLIPFMKVRRDITFPGERDRHETDGEHTFTLVMIAVTLVHRLELDLDIAKVIQYVLVHDLVEAHAGDVSARSTEQEQLVKIDREHEALMTIKERFAKTTPWIPEYIEAYESKSDEESKFVYALDKQMGYYNYLLSDKPHWIEGFPKQEDYHRTSTRLRKKASMYPDLVPLIDTLHNELDKRSQNFS